MPDRENRSGYPSLLSHMGLGRKGQENKKTGVAEYPKVFGHAGLLV